MTLRVLLPVECRLDHARLPPEISWVPYRASDPTPPADPHADGLVVWGNSADQLRRAVGSLPALRWVQTLSSGADAALTAGFPPQVTMSSGKGLHDDPVAEHALALLLALVRGIPELARAQARHHWSHELRRAQSDAPAAGAPVRSLVGAHVVIWGYGSIGRRLAGMLVGLGASITGIASRPRSEEHRVVGQGDALAVLPDADAVVALVPATPGNRHVVGEAAFEQVRSGAWFVNVGRGSTVDESALLRALDRGVIAGAGLDVFEHEPLPSSSALWSHERVLISPHVAGGRPQGAEALLTENAARLLAGTPLINTLPR